MKNVWIAADFSCAMQLDSTEIVDDGQRAEEDPFHFQPIAQFSKPLVPPLLPPPRNLARRRSQPEVGVVVPAAASAQISQEMLIIDHQV